MRLIPYIKAAQAVKSEHPLLGQPVVAADLDEDGPVQSQHGRVALQLRRRRHEERRRDA
jgi:hypothetical protein